MKREESRPEAWLRGSISGVPPLLQPIAHALIQAREDADSLTSVFPPELLWTRPSGLASVGFHLLHISGTVDRLFTYARDEPLSRAQLDALAAENSPGTLTIPQLTSNLHQQVDRALEQLRGTDEGTLTSFRGVGRARLPSTVIGLLGHAAEHAQRHVGQLLVTIRIQHPGDAG